MLDAASILGLQDAANRHGHDAAVVAPQPGSPLEDLILQQHLANFELWHEEDGARDPRVTDAIIAERKHSIDRLNQLRNDLVERIDAKLFQATTQNDSSPLHSETPGLIIDRLSILALKIFHTEEETHRSTPQHQEWNRSRLAVLLVQRADLTGCLHDFWQDVLAGRRRFKLYRQMKMYNDPALNPAFYNASKNQ